MAKTRESISVREGNLTGSMKYENASHFSPWQRNRLAPETAHTSPSRPMAMLVIIEPELGALDGKDRRNFSFSFEVLGSSS